MSIIEVKVPDIGDFKDVPVIEVLVKPGDAVKAEDSLVTLESDKATMDVPSPAAGVVKEVKVKVGDKVAEGTLVLLLEAGDAAAAAGSRARSAAAPPPRAAPAAAPRRRRRSRTVPPPPAAPPPPPAPAAAPASAGAVAGGTRPRQPVGAPLRARTRRRCRAGEGHAARRAASCRKTCRPSSRGVLVGRAGAGARPPAAARPRPAALAAGRFRQVRPGRDASRCRASRRSPAPTSHATG